MEEVVVEGNNEKKLKPINTPKDRKKTRSNNEKKLKRYIVLKDNEGDIESNNEKKLKQKQQDKGARGCIVTTKRN